MRYLSVLHQVDGKRRRWTFGVSPFLAWFFVLNKMDHLLALSYVLCLMEQRSARGADLFAATPPIPPSAIPPPRSKPAAISPSQPRRSHPCRRRGQGGRPPQPHRDGRRAASFGFVDSGHHYVALRRARRNRKANIFCE